MEVHRYKMMNTCQHCHSAIDCESILGQAKQLISSSRCCNNVNKNSFFLLAISLQFRDKILGIFCFSLLEVYILLFLLLLFCAAYACFNELPDRGEKTVFHTGEH